MIEQVGRAQLGADMVLRVARRRRLIQQCNVALVVVPAHAAQRKDVRERRPVDAGQRTEARFDLLEKRQRAPGRHACAARIEIHEQDAVLREAGVDRHEIAQFKIAASHVLNLTAKQLTELIKNGDFVELDNEVNDG